MSKWKGAAGWSEKEARAGDRLPYLRLIDESTVLLRDGSVMTSIEVPGLLFETEDSEALNAHGATREVMLRSTLDSRFVMYHHVIRRRVEVELEAEFDDPLARHIDDRWKQRSVRSCHRRPSGHDIPRVAQGPPVHDESSHLQHISSARAVKRLRNVMAFGHDESVISRHINWPMSIYLL